MTLRRFTSILALISTMKTFAKPYQSPTSSFRTTEDNEYSSILNRNAEFSMPFSHLCYLNNNCGLFGSSIRKRLPRQLNQLTLSNIGSKMYPVTFQPDISFYQQFLPIDRFADNMLSQTNMPQNLFSFSLFEHENVPHYVYQQFINRRPLKSFSIEMPRSVSVRPNVIAPHTNIPKDITGFTASTTKNVPTNSETAFDLKLTTENSTNKQFITRKNETAENVTEVRSESLSSSEQTNESLFDKFAKSLEILERKLLKTTFNRLASISPPGRRENGMSFVQSGLFLHVALMLLSTETNRGDKMEIDQCLDVNTTDTEKLKMITEVLSRLPVSNADLKFRWSNRLAIAKGLTLSQQFVNASDAIRLHLHQFNGTETPKVLAKILNQMVEMDSGGAMHDAFEEEELSSSVRAVLMTTMYMRGRWRAAPTLLNDTLPFYDFDESLKRSTRMFRINDVMKYADLKEWDAEAVEISYATSGLTLLILVPRSRSLRSVVNHVGNTGLNFVTERMVTKRISVTMPLYTLRMTLLLPNKLQAMGISHLVDLNCTKSDLKLSHAVQRIMFWAEAGHNAYKDDGIDWDPAPDFKLLINRPYAFFVRWYNISLVNGNFVL